MSNRNLISGVNSVTVSYLIRYESLLQFMRQLFYYKMRQVFYYKMRQLSQIATILLQNATFSYYILQQYIK